MKTFAIIGASGFVAPRHMKAILNTGNDLIAAMDPSDSVGVMDSYFPDAHFFTSFERFERHLNKLSSFSQGVDFVSVTSPNHLHDSHCRFAMKVGANVICEKPLVLNPQNLDTLRQVEQVTGLKVNTILQLRLHPSIIALRKQLSNPTKTDKLDVELTYIAPRGRWYLQSWKGDTEKSGGIATNIGVHFFDMLYFLFGAPEKNKVHSMSATTGAGYLEYEHACVKWFLSIDPTYLPNQSGAQPLKPYRSIVVNGDEIEFSDGFADLHTRSYEEILKGRGFGIEENRVAIQTVSDIRTAEISTSTPYHPMLGCK